MICSPDRELDIMYKTFCQATFSLHHVHCETRYAPVGEDSGGAGLSSVSAGVALISHEDRHRFSVIISPETWSDASGFEGSV